MTRSASSVIENSFGLPRLRGPVEPHRGHEAHKTVDQVIQIAERAGLPVIALYKDRLTAQGLHDEIGYHAAILGMHARTICIEDARYLDFQRVLAMIIEEQCLRATFALDIAGADPDWIYIAPNIFLAGGEPADRRTPPMTDLENTRNRPLRKTQHVDGAVYACLCRL